MRHPFTICPNRSERRRGRRWIADRENTNEKFKRLNPTSGPSPVPRWRPARPACEAPRRTRNCKSCMGCPENHGTVTEGCHPKHAGRAARRPRGAEHSLPLSFSRNGEDSGTLLGQALENDKGSPRTPRRPSHASAKTRVRADDTRENAFPGPVPRRIPRSSRRLRCRQHGGKEENA